MDIDHHRPNSLPLEHNRPGILLWLMLALTLHLHFCCFRRCFFLLSQPVDVSQSFPLLAVERQLPHVHHAIDVPNVWRSNCIAVAIEVWSVCLIKSFCWVLNSRSKPIKIRIYTISPLHPHLISIFAVVIAYFCWLFSFSWVRSPLDQHLELSSNSIVVMSRLCHVPLIHIFDRWIFRLVVSSWLLSLLYLMFWQEIRPARYRKTTLNQIAERLLQSEDLRERPIFACGIHLCNTCLGSWNHGPWLRKVSLLINWLVVGGLEHQFYFPIYWESHHPNWLSYFSEGWPNHQPDCKVNLYHFSQMMVDRDSVIL